MTAGFFGLACANSSITETPGTASLLLVGHWE
jgi:hypothetical protein